MKRIEGEMKKSACLLIFADGRRKERKIMKKKWVAGMLSVLLSLSCVWTQPAAAGLTEREEGTVSSEAEQAEDAEDVLLEDVQDTGSEEALEIISEEASEERKVQEDREKAEHPDMAEENYPKSLQMIEEKTTEENVQEIQEETTDGSTETQLPEEHLRGRKAATREEAEQIMDEYIRDEISDTLSTYDKVVKICEFVAGYDYMNDVADAYRMIMMGGGDCDASTEAVNIMCEKLGIPAAVRSAGDDPGAYSDHINSYVQIDGETYIVEAGYEGKAPRRYDITKAENKFLYTEKADGTISISRYDNAFDEKVDIPSEIDGKTVTELGKDSFLRHNEIKEVIIPDTVSVIGEWAFYLCTSLHTVTLSENTKAISQCAFYNTGIRRVKIPSQVTEIGDRAFILAGNSWVSPDVMELPVSLQKMDSMLSDTVVLYRGTQEEWKKVSVSDEPKKIFYSSQGLALSEGSLSMKQGETKTLSAYYVSGELSWSSSNPQVAEVQGDGTVKAAGAGTATITATLSDGVTAACEVEVKKAEEAGKPSEPTGTPEETGTPAQPTGTPESTGTPKPTAAPVKLAKPGKVTGLKLSSGTNYVKLTWKKASGAGGYQVERWYPSAGKYKCIATVKGTSYTNQKLSLASAYLYRIRGYVTKGGKTACGDYSSVGKILTKPAVPSSVKITRKGSKTNKAKAVLSLKTSARATEYRIYKYDKKLKKYIENYKIVKNKLYSYQTKTRNYKYLRRVTVKKNVMQVSLTDLRLKSEKNMKFAVKAVVTKSGYSSQYSSLSRVVTLK